MHVYRLSNIKHRLDILLYHTKSYNQQEFDRFVKNVRLDLAVGTSLYDISLMEIARELTNKHGFYFVPTSFIDE